MAEPPIRDRYDVGSASAEPSETRLRPSLAGSTRKRVTFRYDAFISYSHAADGKLAPALESALEGFAKPWYRLRVLEVFRDQTSLAATSELWPEIKRALAASRHFLLLASPEAAGSRWVEQEVDWWLENRRTPRLLIAVTGGKIAWNAAAGDFDWARTNALPPNLKGVFATEPLWVDLRWVKGQEQLSSKDARFQEAVATLAAPLHGRPKEDLFGEDVRQHRWTRRVAWSAVSALIVLFLAAMVAAVVAMSQRDEAVRQARVAFSRQLAAQSVSVAQTEPDLAGLLSLEGLRAADTVEARASLLGALVTNRHLVGTLRGHTGTVWVAFSPDGKTLASASADHTARLWDAATRRPLGEPLVGHTEGLTDVTFSPDGSMLATAGRDETVRLWDVATGTLLSTLEGHTHDVWSVAFSPDGTLLASGSRDRVIILWDVATRQPLRRLEGHTDTVLSLQFSPDGQTLASAGREGIIRLWEMPDGRLRGDPLAGHHGQVLSIDFSPDGKTLVSGGLDGTIRFWDAITGRSIRDPLVRQVGAVNSVAFDPEGKTVASASSDRTILLWDVATGSTRGEPLVGHTSSVFKVDFSPDGTMLASGGDDFTVRLWDPVGRQPLAQTLVGHESVVSSVDISPDGRAIASGSWDGTVRLWDVVTGQPRGLALKDHEAPVRTVRFSPDGRILAIGSCSKMDGPDRCERGEIRLWEVASGRLQGTPLVAHAGMIESIAFSPDGKIFASGATDGKVQLWDTATGLARGAPLDGHHAFSDGSQAEIWSVAFSPDGATLAVGGGDGIVLLWDIATGQQRGPPLTGHSSQRGVAVGAYSVAFSPDGTTLASGAQDKTVRLWDVKTGDELRPPLAEHIGVVRGVTFSPDGRTVAAGTDDRTILLLDVPSHLPLGPPLFGQGGNVMSVAFSPDGTLLVSGGAEGRLMVWDVSIESWRALACQRAGRNLTSEEWRRYLGDQPYHVTCADLPPEPLQHSTGLVPKTSHTVRLV